MIEGGFGMPAEAGLVFFFIIFVIIPLVLAVPMLIAARVIRDLIRDIKEAADHRQAENSDLAAHGALQRFDVSRSR